MLVEAEALLPLEEVWVAICLDESSFSSSFSAFSISHSEFLL